MLRLKDYCGTALLLTHLTTYTPEDSTGATAAKTVPNVAKTFAVRDVRAVTSTVSPFNQTDGQYSPGKVLIVGRKRCCTKLTLDLQSFMDLYYLLLSIISQL